MSTTERVATFLMLGPGGIWAGVIVCYAIERVNLWGRMPIDQFVVDFRRSLYRADPMQPILGAVTAGGGIWFALSTDGTAATLAWIGVGLIALVIAVSFAFPERINSQFRRRAEGEAPPNVEALRAQWKRLHWARTAPAVGAFISLVLAATFV